MRETAPRIKILRLWNSLRSAYWFVPALVIAGCVGLAYLMIEIDLLLPSDYVKHLSWVFTRDPSGAREMLSVISESMITVAGVVFSVTVVALTLASNQFGTRVLKSYARDVGNQIALGTLLGTFLYCIVVMRRVESRYVTFVPSVAVAAGIFLAMLSVAVLVYFIHHAIQEIQAENVIAAVAKDLYETMDTLFPEQLGEGVPLSEEPLNAIEAALIEADGMEICTDREGFVREIDSDRLLRIATYHDIVVRLMVRPGEFVPQRTVIARVLGEIGNADQIRKELKHAIRIGGQRSYQDDVSFGLEQLSLIAVRSLSPAINAVGTALDALERLNASFIRLGERKIPSPYRRDEKGTLRVVTCDWGFRRILNRVLGPVRDAVIRNPSVVNELLRGLGETIARVRNPELRQALVEHLELFAATGSNFALEADRRRLRETYESVRRRDEAA